MGSLSELPDALPPSVAAAVWRADQLGTAPCATLPSGFVELDAVLPGGGWPCRGMTEVLCPQAGVLEWRLLGPALRERLAGRDDRIVLVAPPWVPHAPGIRSTGIDERRLVWIDAQSASERLWVLEQLLRARQVAAVLAWLPDARAAQLRRLQVLSSQTGAGARPVFVFRGMGAAGESSPAPLRVRAWPGAGWGLQVELIKRAGTPLGRVLSLSAAPSGLDQAVPPGRPVRSTEPRMPGASPDIPRQPESWEVHDVVGGASAIRSELRRRTLSH